MSILQAKKIHKIVAYISVLLFILNLCYNWQNRTGMKKSLFIALTGLLVPLAAFSAREGVPSYYQNYNYQRPGAGTYIGQSGQRQVLGQRSATYQVPAPVNIYNGTMTANGIALAAESEPSWVISADYTRKYSTFEFETGVNSILKWNDMIFSEFGINARGNFNLRNFDMFAFGEYRYGTLDKGGLSMDYDLKPFDESQPEYGIFTISMGDMSGDSNYLRFGLGARHVWDLGGWKLSPSIGYEIFHHNLEMSNHYYPNPGIYLPLMNEFGEYIFGDDNGNYFSVPQGTTVSDDYYQVCLSPEDIMIAAVDPTTHTPIITQNPDGTWSLVTIPYDPLTMGGLPWGVGPGECVIIGGDGPVIVDGTTHIYNTTWSGFYVGLEVEKQMTLADKLRFYIQIGLPNYSSDGTWPNRTDWQQNPSFIDKGKNGSYSYRAEMEYNYKVSDRLQLALKVDTNVFHVGKIGGELYVAGYTTYAVDENGQYIYDEVINNGQSIWVPRLVQVDPHTEKISDSLKYAQWQSFGISLGIKYAF